MATSTLPLTRENYESGLEWESYLSAMKDYAQTSRSLFERAEVDSAVVERFASLAERHGGELSISAMTEAWCGDSAVVLPIVARLAERVPALRFRVLIGSDFRELREAYRAEGYESIPLLSLFDKSWKEVGRWMERPQAANAPVQEWVEARPRIAELSGREEPEAKAELKAIFRSLVEEMGEWYVNGLWAETLTELESLLA